MVDDFYVFYDFNDLNGFNDFNDLPFTAHYWLLNSLIADLRLSKMSKMPKVN